MPDKLRIGFLGIAHFHAESYARAINSFQDAEVAAVFEHDEALGRDFAKRFHTVYKKTPEALLEEVDGVVVTAETAFHYPLMKAAANARKHILCEKPITLKEDQARSILKLASERGLTFQMCYVMRYHAAARLVKDSVDEGRIGDVLAIVGTNKLAASLTGTRRWFTTKSLSGGGAVMDHSVHLADLMRWYTGSEAKEVYTVIGKNVNRRIRVEDNFLTTVTFASGALGHIDGSWAHASGYPTWGDVMLEVQGSDGLMFLDAFRQNVYLTGMQPPNNRLTWQYYGCDADLQMVRGFVDSVLAKKQPLASGKDGIEGLRITLASYESAKSGEPVRLD